jgi:hypothetical protein
MNNQPWITLIVSAITDFVISAGGALTTAMVATTSQTLPSTATIVFSVVTGLVAAARGTQKLLTPTPPAP